MTRWEHRGLLPRENACGPFYVVTACAIAKLKSWGLSPDATAALLAGIPELRERIENEPDYRLLLDTNNSPVLLRSEDVNTKTIDVLRENGPRGIFILPASRWRTDSRVLCREV